MQLPANPYSICQTKSLFVIWDYNFERWMTNIDDSLVRILASSACHIGSIDFFLHYQKQLLLEWNLQCHVIIIEIQVIVSRIFAVYPLCTEWESTNTNQKRNQGLFSSESDRRRFSLPSTLSRSKQIASGSLSIPSGSKLMRGPVCLAPLEIPHVSTNFSR